MRYGRERNLQSIRTGVCPLTESGSISKSMLLALLGAAIGLAIVLAVRNWWWIPIGSESGRSGDFDLGSTAYQTSEIHEAVSQVADVSDRDAVNVENPTEDLSLLETASSRHVLELTPGQMVPMVGGGPEQLRSQCSTEIDRTLEESGPGVIRIDCTADEPGFGGLFSQLNAAAYRGTQIRLSAELMARRVHDVDHIEGVGALWIRIDTPDGPVVRNARDDGVRGSTDWIVKEAVVDVPENAAQLSVGVWMQGRGQLLVRNISVDY